MKVEFVYETDFKLEDENEFSDWVNRILDSEKGKCNLLTYVFCDDEFLADINLQYLNHDTFTDIITFDYSNDGGLSGDVFISVERVADNAKTYKVPFSNELKRVMAHGLLHLLGYNDKTENENALMREKEDEKIKMFHVEQ